VQFKKQQEMKQELYVYIPENLNIYELIRKYPPPFTPFFPDILHYIVGLIYQIPAFNKSLDLDETKGYVPIHAKALQKKGIQL